MKKFFIIFFSCISILCNAQTHVFKRGLQAPLYDLKIFKNPFDNSIYLNKISDYFMTGRFNMAKADTGGNLINDIAFAMDTTGGIMLSATNVLPFSGGFICGMDGTLPAIVKMDATGNIIWSKTYVPDLQSLRPVIADEQNNVILSIGTIYTSSSNKNCIILKTDFNGNVISTYKYTMWNGSVGMGPDNLFKLSTGNYLFFVTYMNSIVSYPRVMLQLDNSFNIISSYIIFDCVEVYYVQKPDDGFYAYGSMIWAPGFQTRGFVVNFSPALVTPWAKHINDSIGFRSAQITSDGGIILSGGCTLPNGQADGMLMKLDSSGNLNWARSYGDSLMYESISSLVYEPNDGIYITGTAFDSLNYGFFLKTDSSGKTTCGENSLPVVLNSGGPFSGGSVSFTLSNPVMTDSIVATFPNTGFTLVPSCDGVVSFIENNYSPSSELQIIPNPASSEFQISNFNFEPGDEIIVSDVLGKISFTKKITRSTSDLKLQTSNFLNGIYFLQVKTKEGILGRKVMVQH